MRDRELYCLTGSHSTVCPGSVYEKLVDAYQTRSYWLEILCSTLHSPPQRHGSLANLEVARIPEETNGFKIVR